MPHGRKNVTAGARHSGIMPLWHIAEFGMIRLIGGGRRAALAPWPRSHGRRILRNDEVQLLPAVDTGCEPSLSLITNHQNLPPYSGFTAADGSVSGMIGKEQDEFVQQRDQRGAGLEA